MMKKVTVKKPFRLLKKIKSERVKRISQSIYRVGARLDDGDYVAKICYTHEESKRYIKKLLKGWLYSK